MGSPIKSPMHKRVRGDDGAVSEDDELQVVRVNGPTHAAATSSSISFANFGAFLE